MSRSTVARPNLPARTAAAIVDGTDRTDHTDQTAHTSHTDQALVEGPDATSLRRRARRLGAGALLATTALSGVGVARGGTAQAPPVVTVPVGPVVTVSPTLPPAVTVPPVVTIAPIVTIPPIIVLPPIVTLYQQNVGVTITDNVGAVNANDNVVYKITVTNHWSSAANGVSVLNSLPAGLSGAVWSCTAGAGSSCGGPTTGNGSINRTINLAAGSSAVFTVSAVVNGTTPSIANQVTIVPPVAFGDNAVADNTATDVDALIVPATIVPSPEPTVVPVTTAPPATTVPPTVPATTVPTTAPTTTAPQPPQTIVVVIKQDAPTTTVKKAKVVKKAPKAKKAPKTKVTKKVVKKAVKKAATKH